MAAALVAVHARAMSPVKQTTTPALCCGSPMTSIEVTSPLGNRTSTLALQSCASCGSHIWQRDGETLDRDAVLDIVRERIAEGPAKPNTRW